MTGNHRRLDVLSWWSSTHPHEMVFLNAKPIVAAAGYKADGVARSMSCNKVRKPKGRIKLKPASRLILDWWKIGASRRHY